MRVIAWRRFPSTILALAFCTVKLHLVTPRTFAEDRKFRKCWEKRLTIKQVYFREAFLESVDTVDNQDRKSSVKEFMKHVFENDRRIYAYIYVLIPNKTEADDLFQDTVTIMWEKYETYLPGSDFGAWAIGIAYNLVRSYRRKKAKSPLRLAEDIEQIIEGETTKALSDLDNKLDALEKCFSKLNLEDKEVLKLKYEYDFSTKQIAERIGCSMKVIYTKLARANDFLLRCVRRSLTGQNI